MLLPEKIPKTVYSKPPFVYQRTYIFPYVISRNISKRIHKKLLTMAANKQGR